MEKFEKFLYFLDKLEKAQTGVHTEKMFHTPTEAITSHFMSPEEASHHVHGVKYHLGVALSNKDNPEVYDKHIKQASKKLGFLHKVNKTHPDKVDISSPENIKNVWGKGTITNPKALGEIVKMGGAEDLSGVKINGVSLSPMKLAPGFPSIDHHTDTHPIYSQPNVSTKHNAESINNFVNNYKNYLESNKGTKLSNEYYTPQEKKDIIIDPSKAKGHISFMSDNKQYKNPLATSSFGPIKLSELKQQIQSPSKSISGEHEDKMFDILKNIPNLDKWSQEHGSALENIIKEKRSKHKEKGMESTYGPTKTVNVGEAEISQYKDPNAVGEDEYIDYARRILNPQKEISSTTKKETTSEQKPSTYTQEQKDKIDDYRDIHELENPAIADMDDDEIWDIIENSTAIPEQKSEKIKDNVKAKIKKDPQNYQGYLLNAIEETLHNGVDKYIKKTGANPEVAQGLISGIEEAAKKILYHAVRTWNPESKDIKGETTHLADYVIGRAATRGINYLTGDTAMGEKFGATAKERKMARQIKGYADKMRASGMPEVRIKETLNDIISRYHKEKKPGVSTIGRYVKRNYGEQLENILKRGK